MQGRRFADGPGKVGAMDYCLVVARRRGQLTHFSGESRRALSTRAYGNGILPGQFGTASIPRCDDGVLEFVRLEAEWARAAAVCDCAGVVDEIEPVGMRSVGLIDLVRHVINQGRDRDVHTQSAGMSRFDSLFKRPWLLD